MTNTRMDIPTTLTTSMCEEETLTGDEDIEAARRAMSVNPEDEFTAWRLEVSLVRSGRKNVLTSHDIKLLKAIKDRVNLSIQFATFLSQKLRLHPSELLFFAAKLPRSHEGTIHLKRDGFFYGMTWDYSLNSTSCNFKNRSDQRSFNLCFGPQGHTDIFTPHILHCFIENSRKPWREYSELREYWETHSWNKEAEFYRRCENLWQAGYLDLAEAGFSPSRKEVRWDSKSYEGRDATSDGKLLSVLCRTYILSKVAMRALHHGFFPESFENTRAASSRPGVRTSEAESGKNTAGALSETFAESCARHFSASPKAWPNPAAFWNANPWGV
jgi:hypothetical protein